MKYRCENKLFRIFLELTNKLVNKVIFSAKKFNLLIDELVVTAYLNVFNGKKKENYCQFGSFYITS